MVWHIHVSQSTIMAIVAATDSGRSRSGGRRIRLSSTVLFGILLAICISTLGLLIRTVANTTPTTSTSSSEGGALRTETTTNAQQVHQQHGAGNAEKARAEPSKRKEISAKRQAVTNAGNGDEQPTNTDESKVKSFPKPSELASPNAQVILEPTHGKHSAASDAVFAFAEGYQLHTYVGFVESLKATRYEGDVVLSVSHRSKLSTGVEDYLNADHGDINLVYYAVDWTCWKKNGDEIPHTNGGMSDCQVNGLYGDKTGNQLEDPREARPVATARYELYWIWSLQYEKYRRILLIDVRDTYFQRGPFDDLPVTEEGDADNGGGGVLRLYEENASPSSAAENIGKSSFNSKWISGAYGKQVLDQLRDKPVICSGSTIGDAVAIEAYLRAMVAQFDNTRCKMKGCDQGMHQVIYYSGDLDHVDGIDKIIVSKQGEGEINNLAAMRNSPLREQGVLVNGNIINWGDSSISAVVHQYDRDMETSRIIKQRITKWMEAINK